MLAVRSPLPDAKTLGAVGDGVLHVQILKVVLLVGNNNIDVVGGLQTVVHSAEKAVGIRRKVDTDNFRRLVGNNIEETGVLVSEAIVVLAPDGGGKQDVERGNFLSPRHLVALLEPLCVQQVTFQPALDCMLTQNLHDSSRRSEIAAIFVFLKVVGHPNLLSNVVNSAKLVGLCLVRAEQTEVVGVLAQWLAWPLCKTAVSDGVGTHTAVTTRSELTKLVDELAVLEQLLRLIAAHPLLKQSELVVVFEDVGERDLMSSPKTFKEVTVNSLPDSLAFFWMALISVTALSKVAAIAWCIESRSEPSTKTVGLLILYPFSAVPAGCQRTSLGFTISNHGTLSTLVDTARSLWSCVTANASRERELLEEALHAIGILRLVGVNLRVDTLEVTVGNDSRSTVSRTRNKESIKVVLLDQTVHVNVCEGLTSVRAPVSKETRLDVLNLERFLEKRVLSEVKHTQAQVHAGMEVAIDLVDLILAEGLVGHSCPDWLHLVHYVYCVRTLLLSWFCKDSPVSQWHDLYLGKEQGITEGLPEMLASCKILLNSSMLRKGSRSRVAYPNAALNQEDPRRRSTLQSSSEKTVKEHESEGFKITFSSSASVSEVSARLSIEVNVVFDTTQVVHESVAAALVASTLWLTAVVILVVDCRRRCCTLFRICLASESLLLILDDLF
ncbi:D-xylulose 5-phosphate/D-fructose 6-phosphate phosphoketolase, partial [Aureobasidium melanogenum]